MRDGVACTHIYTHSAVPVSDAHLDGFPPTLDVAMGDGEMLHMPTHAVGWVASAYCIIRALSWQLKVSPFSFPDLVAALCLPQPGPIVDDLHVAILRYDLNGLRVMMDVVGMGVVGFVDFCLEESSTVNKRD